MNWIMGLLHNLAFISAFASFLAAQILKVIIYKDFRVFGVTDVLFPGQTVIDD